MPENIGQLPEETESYSIHAGEATEDSKEKRSLSDRLKSRAKNYVKIALITVATLSPMSRAAAEGSAGIEGEKIENVQEDKELSEEEKSLIKEMQQLANAKAEQISKDYPEISIEDIDKFQQQAWDMAAFIVQNGGDLESYKFTLEQLSKDTFSQEQESKKGDKEDTAREFTEDEKNLLKQMQQVANQEVEQMSIDYKNVSKEKLEKFQQMLWDFGAFIIQQGGDMESFKYGMREFQKKHFAEEIINSEKEKLSKAVDLAGEVAPTELDSSVTIDAEWMWNNVDKIFRIGDTLLVVKSAQSRDLQVSIDKASLIGRGALSRLLKEAKGGSKEGPSSEILIHSRARKMDMRKDGKMYHTVVVMEMPLSANIK